MLLRTFAHCNSKVSKYYLFVMICTVNYSSHLVMTITMITIAWLWPWYICHHKHVQCMCMYFVLFLCFVLEVINTWLGIEVSWDAILVCWSHPLMLQYIYWAVRPSTYIICHTIINWVNFTSTMIQLIKW